MKIETAVHPAMARAMDLIRQGALGEATAIIQHNLSGAGIPSADSNGSRAEGSRQPIEGEYREVDRPPRSWGAPEAPRTAERTAQEDKHVKPDTAFDGVPGTTRGKTVSGSFRNQAGSRAYRLYIPHRYDGEPSPLVIMLHGCTQNPDDFARGTDANALAEEFGCLVAYPSQERSANSSGCWNWFDAGQQRREGAEPSLIAGITRTIAAQYAIDRRRIYVAGMSAGGAMAAVMAATYPDLFAAVGVHSGLPFAAARDMVSALAAMKNGGDAAALLPATGHGAELGARLPPLIVFHGDRDATVHPRNAQRLVEQWAAQATAIAGANVAGLRRAEETGEGRGGRGYTRHTLCRSDGRAIVERWSLRGAGHTWSGGSPLGSYTDAKGPNATREMMRFFADNPQPAA